MHTSSRSHSFAVAEFENDFRLKIECTANLPYVVIVYNDCDGIYDLA